MLNIPMDVLTMYPVRKTRTQKYAFRNAVEAYASRLGYSVYVQDGRSKNVVIGDPEKAKYLITAHYDTCASLPTANKLYADNGLLYALNQLYIGLRLTVLPVFISLILAVVAMMLYFTGAVSYDPGFLRSLGVVVFFYSLLLLLIVSHYMAYNGPANKSNANDNTSGIVTLLELMRSLPESQRHKVCFVLFDRNESGLQGSASYCRKHRRELENQLVLNLSCVGDGDHIFLFPTKELKMNVSVLAPIYKCCGYFGPKSILVQEKGSTPYPSDHIKFPYAVGISAFKKGKSGHYIDRIHTAKDTVLDITNVNLLRAAIISMISAAQ